MPSLHKMLTSLGVSRLYLFPSEYFNMYVPAALSGEMQMCVEKQLEAL